MTDSQNSPTLGAPDQPAAGRFSLVTIAIAAVTLLAIGASLWFLFQPPNPNKMVNVQQTIPLHTGAAEGDYASNIRFEKIELTREANGLGQEVTTLHGEVSNAGPRPVAEIMLTVQFNDSMNQIVLRETRRVVGVRAQPLGAAETRAFEIAFDNIPGSWNMQQPSLHIAAIQFAPKK
jgi:hypothetical protein